jgi:hypothetical protein
VEIEPDTARIVELKNTSSLAQAGSEKFSDQVAQSAGHFDAELTRFRNAIQREQYHD